MQNFNLFQWLFTDPVNAGAAVGAKSEAFHFYVPWIVFCAGSLLAWVYYNVEGRKRVVHSDALWRSILDRLLNHLALIAFVGFIIIFFRWSEAGIFSWRFWRYLWLLWLVVFSGRWALYFMFKYKEERLSYDAYRTHQRYVAQPKSKRAARASTR